MTNAATTTGVASTTGAAATTGSDNGRRRQLTLLPAAQPERLDEEVDAMCRAVAAGYFLTLPRAAVRATRACTARSRGPA